MSGEGVISNVSEVRARIEEHLRPRFDKRPGALEATRGLELVGAVGVAGPHNRHEFDVRLQLSGGLQVDLSIAEARRHARDVVMLCDMLERGIAD